MGARGTRSAATFRPHSRGRGWGSAGLRPDAFKQVAPTALYRRRRMRRFSVSAYGGLRMKRLRRLGRVLVEKHLFASDLALGG
jgi:hypothetical protein